MRLKTNLFDIIEYSINRGNWSNFRYRRNRRQKMLRFDILPSQLLSDRGFEPVTAGEGWVLTEHSFVSRREAGLKVKGAEPEVRIDWVSC